MKSPLLNHLRRLFNDASSAAQGAAATAGGRQDAQRPGVHPTAVVRGEVELEDGATVGPYCVIEGRVKVGARTRVLAHTVIEGTTFVGADCRLGPHAAVGTAPQHRAHDAGIETYLVIGDGVVAREFSTMHRSTRPGLEHATRVGHGSMVMAGAHVAHDCRLGERVTLANAVQLGGHVTVDDDAFVGGGVVAHQFCRIGRLAIVSGGEIVSKDVLPFGAFKHGGHRAYNAVGCRRARIDGNAIHAIRAAFATIHAWPSVPQAIAAIRRAGDATSTAAAVREIVDFVESSRRGIHASASANAEPSAEISVIAG